MASARPAIGLIERMVAVPERAVVTTSVPGPNVAGAFAPSLEVGPMGQVLAEHEVAVGP